MKLGSNMFHPRSIYRFSMFTFKPLKNIPRLKKKNPKYTMKRQNFPYQEFL